VERFRELVSSGCNDVEIAAVMNCTVPTATKWRAKLASGQGPGDTRGRPSKKTAGSPEGSPAFLDNSPRSQHAGKQLYITTAKENQC
jgi:hypothetical protein